MKNELQEALLLFILVLVAIKDFFLSVAHVLTPANPESIIFILLIGILLCIFFYLSFFGGYSRYRLITFIAIVAIFFSYTLFMNDRLRVSFPDEVNIHDGALQTELAISSLLKGVNPYSISYASVLRSSDPANIVFNHYVYSPVMFLVTMPVVIIMRDLFQVNDIRFVFGLFFLITGIIGARIVQNKIFFLTLFWFNPLFLPLLFFGANDVVTLLFLIGAISCLHLRKKIRGIVLLSMSIGTKILVLPFVPIYFIFLYMLVKRKKRQFLSLLFLFIIITMSTYAPFYLWNKSDFIEDLFIYPFAGGNASHPVVGIAIPQLLHALRIIPEKSSFPFHILQLFILGLWSLLSFSFMEKIENITTLCILSSLGFLLVLAFSRIVQTNYIAFVSQILVLAVCCKPFLNRIHEYT